VKLEERLSADEDALTSSPSSSYTYAASQAYYASCGRLEERLSADEDALTSSPSSSYTDAASQAYYAGDYGAHEREFICAMQADCSSMHEGDRTAQCNQPACAEPLEPFGCFSSSSEAASEICEESCEDDGKDVDCASVNLNSDDPNCSEPEVKLPTAESKVPPNAFLCYCWRLCRRLPDVKSRWAPTEPVKCSDFTSKSQSAFFRSVVDACKELQTTVTVHACVANACGWWFEFHQAGGIAAKSESKGGSKLTSDRIILRRMKAAATKLRDQTFAPYSILVEGGGKILLQDRRAAAFVSHSVILDSLNSNLLLLPLGQ
jgi:hypothetical protein